MTTMTKKRVAELEGAQLDWAVAKIEHPRDTAIKQRFLDEEYAYSSDWSQGGPIIERENIWLSAPAGVLTQWSAAVGDATDAVRGPTPLIAAMRAFVAAKLCDEVEVPV